MEYISVKDRKPEMAGEHKLASDKVLIAQGVNDKKVSFGYYTKNGVWVTTANEPFARQDLITHWMPLPEPPSRKE